MECGVSIFPWKDRCRFSLGLSTIRRFCCSAPELATRCSPTRSGITPELSAALGVSTEKCRLGTHPELSFWKCSFGQTAYILILQQDDSWNKRAISETQAFLLLSGDGLVPPCTAIPRHPGREFSVLLSCLPALPLWNPPPQLPSQFLTPRC